MRLRDPGRMTFDPKGRTESRSTSPRQASRLHPLTGDDGRFAILGILAAVIVPRMSVHQDQARVGLLRQ